MYTSDNNNFKILLNRKIYDIIDGDTKFGYYTFEDNNSKIPISMPYLSGSSICNISGQFGLHQNYSWKGKNLSRWQYLENLFIFCIENNKISDLLSFLFNKYEFYKMFSDHNSIILENAYSHFVNKIIDNINNFLLFSDNKISIINDKFIISKKSDCLAIKAPAIKSINREYIKNISERALNDINNNDFDSAITKSRTLIEEVFCHTIEYKCITPVTSGKISELYKQVKDLYHMHFDNDMDIRIKTLLSGLEKIISSISEMRNKNSDAHGVGSKRLEIKDYHARLFVNSAMTISEFILSVQKNSK